MHEEWVKGMARKIKPRMDAPPAPRGQPAVKRCPKCTEPVLSVEQIAWLRRSLSAEDQLWLRWCTCSFVYPGGKRATESVYLIGNLQHGFVKVGYSHGATYRIADIQSYLPFEIKTFALLLAPMRVERAIHRYLKRAQSRGEWFRVTPAVLDLLERAQSGELQRAVDDWLAQAKPGERMDIGCILERDKKRLARVKKSA